MLSERVKDRLAEWKFASASSYMLEDEVDGPAPTEHERETVEALSTTFGNCGWFDGSLGDVVRAAVWYLGVTEDS